MAVRALMLTYHGGECCGIKHLKGFPLYKWEKKQPSLRKVDLSKKVFPFPDSCGAPVRSNMRFFTDYAPVEDLEERLDRLLAFCKDERPGGIVEAVLAKGNEYDQVALFQDMLISKGFTLVNTVINSNSDNECRVYHLNMEE